MISIRGVCMTNYKKIKKGLLFTIALVLVMIPGVSHAEDGSFVFCEGNVLVAFRLFGLALGVVKILVPIILVVLTMVNVLKAIMDGDDKAYKGSAKLFFQRVFISLIIFFLPTIVNGILTLVSAEYRTALLDENSSDSFAACTKCLLNISMCDRQEIEW